MNEKDEFALVPKPPSSLQTTGLGLGRILSAMVGDALALANRNLSDVAAASHRIGEYEWCEPDYRQLLIWAEALRIEPENLVQKILDQRSLYVEDDGQQCMLFPIWEGPLFAAGRLLLISWNFDLLPLWKFEWVEELRITHLRFLVPYGEFPKVEFPALPLPWLVYLSCCNMGLPSLDLSTASQLEYLTCASNRLQTLDLSATKRLKRLDCDGNDLNQLDLSQTPGLKSLSCAVNSISKLDLSATPSLQILECGQNPIERLDLAAVHNLKCLSCWNDELFELNLTGLTNLAELDCSGNSIGSLDLRAVPQLRELNCGRNQLRRLALSAVSALEQLDCSGNEIAELDLSECPNLEKLNCRHNWITVLDIRPLEHLDELNYDAQSTRLIQRPDQDFEP